MTFSHGMTDDRDDLPGPGQGGCPRDVDLHRVWLGVAAEVWRRRPGLVERLAGRALRSPGLARALVTTPSLLLGWVIASAVVLAAGMVATRGTGTPFVALSAPAVAAAGIAYAYGPGIDPAWELSQTMAVSDRMVLLVRVLAVSALNAALGLAASAASGPPPRSRSAADPDDRGVGVGPRRRRTSPWSGERGVAAGLAAWAIMGRVRRTRPPVWSPRWSPAPRSSGPTWRDAAVCCATLVVYPYAERNVMNVERSARRHQGEVRRHRGGGRRTPAHRPRGVRAAAAERCGARRMPPGGMDGHGHPAEPRPLGPAGPRPWRVRAAAGDRGAGSVTCRRIWATTRASRWPSSSSISRC